jgi:hypothetical protein
MKKRNVKASVSFRTLMARLEAENARRLWRKAIIAESVGHISRRPDTLDRYKAAVLSQLRRLACLFVSTASVTPDGVLLLVGSDSSVLPVYLHQLDADVQDEIAPVVVELLEVQHPASVGGWISQEEGGV